MRMTDPRQQFTTISSITVSLYAVQRQASPWQPSVNRKRTISAKILSTRTLSLMCIFIIYIALHIVLMRYDENNKNSTLQGVRMMTFISSPIKTNIVSPSSSFSTSSSAFSTLIEYKDPQRQQRIEPLFRFIHRSSQGQNGTISFQQEWPSQYILHRLPNNRNTTIDSIPKACIVTAYFRLYNLSKHNEQQYDIWMANMLSIQDCMVIYCESDMVSKMINYRTKSTSKGIPTAIIELSIYDLPISNYSYHPTTSTTIASPTSMTPKKFWINQLDIDPEKRLHRNYQLFWIWLSKSWFVTTAILLQHHLFPTNNYSNNNNSYKPIEIWMWSDIGSFRKERFNNEPLIQTKYIHDIIPDDNSIVWMAHRVPNPYPNNVYWNNKIDPVEQKHFYHSGSQAIGRHSNAWVKFHQQFIITMDEYVTKYSLFIGEDQCILQTTCLLYPQSCVYVPFNQVNDNKYFGLRYVIKYGPNKNISDFISYMNTSVTTTTTVTTPTTIKRKKRRRRRNNNTIALGQLQQPFRLWRPQLVKK